MTKTVHPVLKKTGAVLLTVLVLVLMAVPAFAVALPDAPTGYVYDGANVLSSSTESYIERTGSALAEACGAEVVVATVDFTDGEDIADYAYDLFNKWGIGDKKANNGLLILLSIGAEDYYAEPGVGLTDVFTGGVLDAMLYDYLEGDFAAKEYDSGVKKATPARWRFWKTTTMFRIPRVRQTTRMRTPIIIMRIIIHPAEFYTDFSASSRGSGGSSLWFCSSF